MGTPPQTPPPTPPSTMGRWAQQLRPWLYLVFILFILLIIASVLGQIGLASILFILIFVIIVVGIVWTRTHPEEDYTETMIPWGTLDRIACKLAI